MYVLQFICVSCLLYKICLSFLNLTGRGLVGRGLTHLWPAGMGSRSDLGQA